MGNKLCAPLWKKHPRDGDSPFNTKKDAHLLRLWAEIYEVAVDDDGPRWQKIVEDTVPINVIILKDGPETVFQVTAYNRHVERVFDVKIKQPGTVFSQSSDCFLHWKDGPCEWGLNFASAGDAKKYRDCCSHPIQQWFRRKSPSSSSLKLSPPKRWRSKRGKSAPGSPVSKPKRSVSSPEEITHGGFGDIDPDFEEYGAPVRAKSRSLAQSVATMPRVRQRNVADSRDLFPDNDLYSGPSSDLSMYDSYNSSPRKGAYDASKGGSLRERQERRRPRGMPFPPKGSTLNEEDLKSILYDGGGGGNPMNSRQGSTSGASAMAGSELSSPNSEKGVPPPLPPKLEPLSFSRNSREQSVPKSSSSEDWPAPPDPIAPMTPQTPIMNADFDPDSIKRMLQDFPENSNNDLGFVEQQQQQQSGSHYLRNVSHDPKSSSSSKHRNHNSHHVNRVQSLNMYDRHYNNSNGGHESSPHAAQLPKSPTSPTMREDGSFFSDRDSQRSGKDRMLMEYELALRNACAKESYPDSGIGGTASEAAGSVRSGGSSKSGSKSSSTLTPGASVSSNRTKSKSKSSSSGGSGRGSQYTRQESTEVTQFVVSSEGSDDEADDSDSDSSIHTMPSESQASFARQTGATRKAGWLTVKNWLIHKKRKVELAPKRNWKKYWVCLKGTTLLFFTCDDQSSMNVAENAVPRHMLVIEGGVSQAVPEHPKRENIFALSTAFGDAYLFEAQSQIEQENWISAIHSACASLFARQHGKDNTLKLLRSEIHKLENSIDIDIKMKKMADLQLTVVSDTKSKHAISKQIAQWEENLEKLYIEQYRLRCYMASLQGSELPNPKTLLTNVSKSTKSTLARLGVFTVTSFHALVCARTPLTMATLYNKVSKKKGGRLSTFMAEGGIKLRSKTPTGALSPSNVKSFKDIDINEEEDSNSEYLYSGETDDTSVRGTLTDTLNFGDNLNRILLPNNQTIVVAVHGRMTVLEVLETVCNKRQLNPNDHFVRLKLPGQEAYTVPDKMSFMERETYEKIEVCAKIIFQLELHKSQHDADFGFGVEAELAEDSERDDELCIFISEVRKGGLAYRKGLYVGDELLVINSKVVSDLDMVFVEVLIQDSKLLCLTIRSCRTERPPSSRQMEHVDIHIDNMVCPPPPSQSRISDKVIDELIVPAPNWVQEDPGTGDVLIRPMTPPRMMPGYSTEQIHLLLQKSEQVTQFVRQSYERDFVDGPPVPLSLPSRESESTPKPMSLVQKLRKVTMELIDTERAYVKDLNCLIERYLEPLKEETFLTSDETEALFGNIQEIVQFQKLFLRSLEEAVDLEPDFLTFSDPKQFRRILFSLGGSFLYYANHFKLYSSFCASHSKAQKVLQPESNSPLREFLRARNPKQQHSATLESYLIKPIQRILKYPLLLNQLRSLTVPETDEHYHLSEALKGMEAVAEHINEMQKIYEEYGTVFDDLVRCYKEAHSLEKETIELNVGDLHMYGAVEWLNASDRIGRLKKGNELVTILFVFKSGVVLLCKERPKAKKRARPASVRGSMVDQEMTRYQTVIPVNAVQVRSHSNNDAHTQLYWELLHMKSEKEGRPEKVYQMANSTLEAKNDFMRTIRQIIRDSVRQMRLPLSTPARGKGYIPYGGKRLANLTGSNQRSLSKKRGQRVRSAIERHSMEFDNDFNVLDQDDLRARSMTFSDLNNTDADSTSEGGYPTSAHSQASIDSKSSTGSAKLVHSSHNPLNYSPASSSIGTTVELGSPIWKPRDALDEELKTPVPFEDEDDSATLILTSPYSDYSSTVYVEENKAMLLAPPSAYVEQGDTEC